MHGLRKNAGMELAEAGATVEEIMAVLGHKTPKMAMFYCEQARQAVMNENAGRKVGCRDREAHGQEGRQQAGGAGRGCLTDTHDVPMKGPLSGGPIGEIGKF
jgi:hypothetical protein